MAKHETKKATQFVAILRNWREIDPKVLQGLLGSVTVGAIVSAGAAIGWNIPTPVAAGIVIAAYFLVSYWTKTTIPVADDIGLTARQSILAAGASVAGDELADGDLLGAAHGAFEAAGIATDEDGVVIDQTHPLIATAGDEPQTNTLAP